MLQHPEYLPDPGVPLSVPMGVSAPVAHRAWGEARHRALASVRAGEGLILVLGPPGTGKSLLLRDLARTLGDAGYDVLLQARGDIPIEAAKAGAGNSERPGPRVVLIDEADRMNGAALERLGQLGARSFVLARMASSGDGPGRLPATPVPATPVPATPVPATIVRLAPLPPAEIGAFAAARLARHSGGVPRVLDMLISAAAFLATTENAARVEAEHIDRAAAMRDGDGTMPDATPISPEMDSTPPRDAEPGRPGPYSLGQLPSRGRAGALSAVVGIAALCGWLALRPSEPTQRAQLTLAQPPATIAGPAGPDRPDMARGARPGAAPAAPVAAAMPASIPEQGEGARGTPAPPGMPGPNIATLPASAPAHVVVHYARGDADAATRAADLVRTLRAAGMMVADPVAAALRTGRPGVRYFFAEDQQTASTVLERAGLSAGDLLAGAARPGFLPRPGMIEVAVPSS